MPSHLPGPTPGIHVEMPYDRPPALVCHAPTHAHKLLLSQNDELESAIWLSQKSYISGRLARPTNLPANECRIGVSIARVYLPRLYAYTHMHTLTLSRLYTRHLLPTYWI